MFFRIKLLKLIKSHIDVLGKKKRKKTGEESSKVHPTLLHYTFTGSASQDINYYWHK